MKNTMCFQLRRYGVMISGVLLAIAISIVIGIPVHAQEGAVRGAGVDARVIEEGVLQVTLLGVGGGPHAGERSNDALGINYSTLVEIEDVAFLFDAGRGTAEQIASIGKANFQKVDKLYLTHLHSDHNIGLPDLWATAARTRLRTAPMQVFGPAGTKEMAEHIEAAFEYSFRYSARPSGPLALIGKDITQGVVYQQDGIIVTAFDVDHTPSANPDTHDQFPALGFRVDYNDRSVVISGDTRFSENLIKYSQGVDVLIHEVTEGDNAGHHTTRVEAAEIFNRVGPQLAVYSHILHGVDEQLTRDTREADYSGPLLVGNDMDVIIIGDEVTIRRAGDTADRD
jgi:ribonuclease Z